MTDAFYAATAITGHDQIHAPLPATLNFSHHHHFGAPNVDAAHEDDGQISCFCGFPDDDGNTVACDLCNRWQHTLCYYPEYDGQELPADLSHYCVDCRPRAVNAHAANARQQARREHQPLSYNGPKRQISKSHKKKVKEPNGVPYTNGWPLDKARHDRNSASPRDQPPPAKRPKTTHRTSDSATNSSKGHSRKRTVTNTERRSLSRSPDFPISLYSQEFVHCYHHDEWSLSHANVMDELRVTNALSEWLQASDEVFFDLTGTTKPEVLNRWDGELDDIPGKVPLDVQLHSDPTFLDGHGNIPAWKSITVRDPLAAGAYIGELRGRIGFKDEYKTDTGNRWSALRHPEPFVFFHHRLPIYIDARHEGTELRYVRRSCTPNARLQVLVTNGTDYHFCFMAITQIDPGMEVAVGWDTTDSILRQSTAISQVSQDDMVQLSTWVSTVLANCGPCACQLPPGECYMSRFDKRLPGNEAEEEDEAQSSKLPKSKKKKTGQHISPLDTHALNSRSGSEARKIEPDEEPTDSRSASGSAGRGSDSRDNTPNTHYSANGSLSTMPELSERERKKLAREEEIFRRQEEEQSGKQAKKKRHSAGSNATTPGPTSSKQSTFPSMAPRYSDAGTAKQAGLPPAKLSTGKRGRPSMQKKPVKSNAPSLQRPKPTYVDSSSQCDMDQEEAEQRAAERAATPKKRYISLTQRLLQRCAVNNARSHHGDTSMSPRPGSAHSEVKRSTPSPRERSTAPTISARASREGSHQPAAKAEVLDDVSMTDTSPEDQSREHAIPVPHIHEPAGSPNAMLSNLPAWSPHAAEPPVPPWFSNSSPIMQEAPLPSMHAHKPANMHLNMPPPPANPFAGPQSTTSANSAILTGPIAQSPASLMTSLVPLFSPSVTAAVAPSPARKKMSLSDYTKRTKAKDKEPGEGRESSPASVVSASGLPIVPGLPHSSSQFGSQAIEDDVKMEDA